MPAEIFHPRIVLELLPDGTIQAEAFINGSRSKIPLNYGVESFEIREILETIKADRNNQADRAAARKAKEEASLHRRAWTGVAEAHGVPFANKIVGKVPGIPASEGKLPKAPHAPQGAAGIAGAVKASLSLLDD